MLQTAVEELVCKLVAFINSCPPGGGRVLWDLSGVASRRGPSTAEATAAAEQLLADGALAACTWAAMSCLRLSVEWDGRQVACVPPAAAGAPSPPDIDVRVRLACGAVDCAELAVDVELLPAAPGTRRLALCALPKGVDYPAFVATLGACAAPAPVLLPSRGEVAVGDSPISVGAPVPADLPCRALADRKDGPYTLDGLALEIAEAVVDILNAPASGALDCGSGEWSSFVPVSIAIDGVCGVHSASVADAHWSAGRCRNGCAALLGRRRRRRRDRGSVP